jgi:hypothetical protein
MCRCAELPEWLENGLAMKLASLPCRRATSLAAYFSRALSSAATSASVYTRLVSTWPGPYSVWMPSNRVKAPSVSFSSLINGSSALAFSSEYAWIASMIGDPSASSR